MCDRNVFYFILFHPTRVAQHSQDYWRQEQ